MVHKQWLSENKDGVELDIEIFYPETKEENEQFDKAIEKLELMSYFLGN